MQLFFRVENHNEVTLLIFFFPICLSSRFCRFLSSGRIKGSLWYQPRKTWASGRCWETKHHLNYLALKLHSWALFTYQPVWLKLHLATLLLEEQSLHTFGSVFMSLSVCVCLCVSACMHICMCVFASAHMCSLVYPCLCLVYMTHQHHDKDSFDIKLAS